MQRVGRQRGVTCSHQVESRVFKPEFALFAEHFELESVAPLLARFTYSCNCHPI